jgi:hypothetical protein
LGWGRWDQEWVGGAKIKDGNRVATGVAWAIMTPPRPPPVAMSA